MRKLIQFIFCNKPLSENSNSAALLLLRVFGGAMMIPYGIGKIEKFSEYSVNFFEDPIGIGMMPSLILTIFAQLFCSIFLIAGLFSRPTAIVLALNMIVACKYHWHDDFATLSLPLLFFGIYCMQALVGGGRYSLDTLIFKNREK